MVAARSESCGRADRMSCADSLLVATPGQRPPHDVQKKALAEPVVASSIAKSSAISGAGPTLSSFKCSIIAFPRLQALSVRPLARMRCYGSRGVATLASHDHRRRHAVRNHRSPRYPGFNVLAWTSDLHQQIERSRPGGSSNLVPAVSTIRITAATARVQACRNLLRSAGTEPLPRQWSRIRRAKSAHGV